MPAAFPNGPASFAEISDPDSQVESVDPAPADEALTAGNSDTNVETDTGSQTEPIASQPSATERSQPKVSDEELVSLETSNMRTRIRELERRTDDLERTDRYLDERIRNLDRLVDDLKRRR